MILSLTAVVWFIRPISTVIITVTEVPCCVDTTACIVTRELVLATCCKVTTNTHPRNMHASLDIRSVQNIPLTVQHTSQLCDTPFTRYNWFSNRLNNRLDNRLNVCTHDTTGCETGLTTGWITGCIMCTNMQPVVQPVFQPVWLSAVSCIQTMNGLSNRLFNRLYKFNTFDLCNPTFNRSHALGCSTSLITGWTTGCVV